MVLFILSTELFVSQIGLYSKTLETVMMNGAVRDQCNFLLMYEGKTYIAWTSYHHVSVTMTWWRLHVNGVTVITHDKPRMVMENLLSEGCGGTVHREVHKIDSDAICVVLAQYSSTVIVQIHTGLQYEYTSLFCFLYGIALFYINILIVAK